MERGAEVGRTSSCVEDHRVAYPLSAAAKSVLAIVRPLGIRRGYVVVDDGRNRFVVDDFEPQWSSVVAYAIDGVQSVAVVGIFRREMPSLTLKESLGMVPG